MGTVKRIIWHYVYHGVTCVAKFRRAVEASWYVEHFSFHTGKEFTVEEVFERLEKY